MRGFLIISWITVALSAPQYNYNQPQASVGHHAVAGQAQKPAIWNKQFSIYSAPEDGLDGAGNNLDQSAIRKNLRVVIVKAPENKGLTDAALQLAKSASDDKTAVYVLTKETDLGELQNKLAQSKDINANKPEVHFVKYRTPEEAEHAQHSIQNQYDQSYQGPSQVSNEGVAPVQSFVGSVPSSSGLAGNFGAQSNYLPPVAPAPQNTYVPPPAPAPIQNTYVPPPAPAPAAVQNTYIPPPAVHNAYLPAFH